MINYNKNTKAQLIELMKVRDDNDKEWNEGVQAELKRKDEMVAYARNKSTEADKLMQYLTDIIDVVSDTRSLGGLNETEINAKLIKGLRIIKHAIKKG